MADLVHLLAWANTLSATAVLLGYFLIRGGYVQLPFLTALIFLTWYLPQTWRLVVDGSMFPVSLARLLLMSLLCFWAMIFGWFIGLRGKTYQSGQIQLPVKRLVGPVALLTLFSWTMTVLIELQPAEVRAASQWTGAITIIYFLSSVSVVSLLLSTTMFIRKRTIWTTSLILFNLLLYIPKLIIYFRRADIFEFLLSILLGLLFARNWIAPKTLILSGMVSGVLLVNGVGQLRALGGGYQMNAAGAIETRIPSLSEIANIDWLSIASPENIATSSEVENAVVYFELAEGTAGFSLGAQYWNKMVLAYVPGQIVGAEFKKNLLFDSDLSILAMSELNYRKQTGTTLTGFVDVYSDFWFLGSAIFFLTGLLMGKMYLGALRGSLGHYTLYGATITNAVHANTHSGYYLFSQSVLIILSVWILFKTIKYPKNLSSMRIRKYI